MEEPRAMPEKEKKSLDDPMLISLGLQATRWNKEQLSECQHTRFPHMQPSECRTCSSGLKTAIEVPIIHHFICCALLSREWNQIKSWCSHLAAPKTQSKCLGGLFFPTAAAHTHMNQLSFKHVMAVTKGMWITIR